jgi:hypothetical protein
MLTSTASAVFHSSLLSLTAVFQSSKENKLDKPCRVQVSNRRLPNNPNTKIKAGFLHRLHWGSACANRTRFSLIAYSPGWPGSCARTIGLRSVYKLGTPHGTMFVQENRSCFWYNCCTNAVQPSPFERLIRSLMRYSR